MSYRNLKINPYGGVDCEFESEEYGWIPYTVPEDHPDYTEIKEKAKPRTKKDEEEDLENLKKLVRSERNNLLAASDWTQLEDSPVSKTAWANYRQKLRDIPQQKGFPKDVVWPLVDNNDS